MEVIRNWNDMEPYGINCLTGEACAYVYRVLCDVNDKGRELLKACFGVKDVVLPENWNSADGANGSIMLALEMLTPLAVFALIGKGCHKIVIVKDGTLVQSGIYGVYNEELEKPEFQRWYAMCQRENAVQRAVTNPGYARNMHVMSGRVA